MKAIIVEDEKYASDRLEKLVKECEPEIEIIHKFDSIEDTIACLIENDQSDFLFLDIHLSDGLSFDIFKKVRYDKPVIFTTAYDEYSLKAFKVNSIDYLLKPVGKEDLSVALEKMKRLNGRYSKVIDLEALDSFFNQTRFRKRFMVRSGNRFIYVDASDVALFFAEGKIAYLMKKIDAQKHIIENTLEELEKQLDPLEFFRVNRKVVISAKEISEIKSYPGNRLQIITKSKAPFDIVVSREKVTKFKSWLDQ